MKKIETEFGYIVPNKIAPSEGYFFPSYDLCGAIGKQYSKSELLSLFMKEIDKNERN